MTPGWPAPDTAVALATVSRRAVAKAIDGLVFVLPVLVVVARYSRVDGDEVVLEAPLWVTLALAVANAAYETVLVAWRGQTLGKLALGIRVVAVDGGRVGWARSGIRALVPMAAGAVPSVVAPVLAVGVYGWALVDPNRQGLHDKAAGTVVVRC